MTMPAYKDSENVCCPDLMIAECADTKEHNHLVCGFSKAIISNKTVKEVCIGDFDKCINKSGVIK